MSAAMAEEEDALTKKLAGGGMVVTTPSAADVAQAEALLKPYWKTWAAARDARTQEAFQKIMPVLGR
jgi:TRAP-type C4-dicarboxylate transport system substrate-binding protein